MTGVALYISRRQKNPAGEMSAGSMCRRLPRPPHWDRTRERCAVLDALGNSREEPPLDELHALDVEKRRVSRPSWRRTRQSRRFYYWAALWRAGLRTGSIRDESGGIEHGFSSCTSSIASVFNQYGGRLFATKSVSVKTRRSVIPDAALCWPKSNRFASEPSKMFRYVSL